MGHIIGVSLLFVGMLLIVNARLLQGKVDVKDAGVFNLIVGSLATLISLSFGFPISSDAQPNIPLMAGGLLVAFTYLWVGINAVRGAEDQRALGYYCLLVAILTIPYSVHAYMGGDIGWTVGWIGYGVLWFLFFMVLAMGNHQLMGFTIFMTYLIGIQVWVTGWLYLYGYWPFGPE